MSVAALSLGSNQHPVEYLRAAVASLCVRFEHMTLSPAWRFPAVGFDGPDFVNAAALIETDFDPWALSDWLRKLEDANGRDRSGPRHGNRTLDIDIVLFDQQIIAGPGTLRIPRDELRHAFVLKPLAAIAPDWLHPQSRLTIAELWEAHPQYGEYFESVELKP